MNEMILILATTLAQADQPATKSKAVRVGIAKRVVDIGVLGKKNIFSPKSPPPPASASANTKPRYTPPPPPPPPAEASYRFVGLARWDDRHFVLIDDQTQQAQYYYLVGEWIGRARLSAVEDGETPEDWRILIEYQGKERLVVLGQPIVDAASAAIGVADGDPYSGVGGARIGTTPAPVGQTPSPTTRPATPNDSAAAKPTVSTPSKPMSTRQKSILEKLKARRKKELEK